ncbi:MAG: thioesterase family protein [Glycocaulis sp.]
MQELWRGNANAWECDELGHMNVRFYIAKAMQGAARLAEMAGMRAPFMADATATLIARTLQVRYLAECHAGVPLVIRGGVSAVSAQGAEFAMVMEHTARGVPAASFLFSFEHADPRSGRAFDWSGRLSAGLEAQRIERPAEVTPRTLTGALPRNDISPDLADRLGMAVTGLGRFGPEDMDVFGRMRPEVAIGKTSDSVIHFREGFPEEWAGHDSEDGLTLGGALLETRVHIRRLPRAGEGYLMRSGLIGANANVRSLVHWMLDPAGGGPLWSIEGVACMMDLKARRLFKTPPERLAVLQERVITGLSV